MSAYPTWTPASRPGIVPLHPLTFGTILGRSFVALRQNPRVLLGFALIVQTLAYIVVLLAVGGVAWAAFSRLDTLRPGTEEFETVLAGSVAWTLVAGIVLGLAAGAIATVVQAVVVVEVTRAVVAEKLTLGQIWRHVKPVVWRVIGYAMLLILAVVAALALVGGALFALAQASAPLAVGLGVFVVLAAIPLLWWLSIKLLLVPATIVVEHARIGQAIARSWRLIRGRFWAALGIVLVVSLVFGAVGQVVGLPFSFLASGLTTIISPTGDPSTGAVIAIVVSLVITYAVILVIQSVAVVVQATATTLIYVDCRMRREGLDLDLLAYVERRDAGAADLPDPYRLHVGREIGPRAAAYPPPPAPGHSTVYGAPPAYASPPPPYAAPPAAAPPHPAPPADPPSPTQWAAPGAPASDPEHRSP